MYSLFRAFFASFFDTLFPLSPHAKSVQDATLEALLNVSAPHSFRTTLVLASYHAPLVRACIHEAKFEHNEHAIDLLGQLLGAYLMQTFSEKNHSEIYVVPVPLSAERFRERGYNQVLEIARSARARVPHLVVHENILKKIRHTPSQTSLSRAERLENLAGVFAVGEHTISHDAHLILFDDIVTTGATLAEASRVLKEVGFTHIDQLALAH